MPSVRVQAWFRIIVVAAIVAAFGQVTLGGVVRVTGSGLGCPDWPLCHGQIIPPFDAPTLIEYSHRLSASVLSLFVVGNAVIVWMRYRHDPHTLYASMAALVLVVAAAILGGLTVLTELEWWAVLIHLAIAEALIACLVFAAIRRWNPGHAPASSGDDGRVEVARIWVIAAVVGVFAVILSGSYMVGYGAGTSCGTWPLCRGSLLPSGMAYAIHMGHRYVAALVGLGILAAAWQAWRAAGGNRPLRFATMALVTVFAVQIILGAVLVWSGFNIDFKAAHLSIATLVWAILISVAALLYLPEQTQESPEPALRHAHV